MKKLCWIVGITLWLFLMWSSTFAQEAGGNYPWLNAYPTLEKVCDYQFGSTLKYAKCKGTYWDIEQKLAGKLLMIKKSIYKKYPDEQARNRLLNALSLKIGLMKKNSNTDTTKKFILEYIQQEIDSWTRDNNSVDDILNDLFNEDSTNNCISEWEISNASLWPKHYKPCCPWLDWFDHKNTSMWWQDWTLWAWVICVDPDKGVPICKRLWNWWNYYMYQNESTLKPYSQMYNYSCEPVYSSISVLEILSEYYPSYLDNSVGIEYNFDAWKFKLKAIWSDAQVEEITIKQIGSLNHTVFEDVYLVSSSNWQKMWHCRLNRNDYCTIDLNLQLEKGDLESFYLETQIDDDAEEWETIQFQVTSMEVENDDTWEELGIDTLPLTIDQQLVVAHNNIYVLKIQDSSWNSSFNWNTIEPGDDENFGYFNLKPTNTDALVEELTIEQIGSLNSTEFEEIKLIRSMDSKVMWQCDLNRNERCTMNLDIHLDNNSIETFYIETEIEHDAEEWETIQFQINNIEVEKDNSSQELDTEHLPFIINRKLTVED